MAPCDDPRKQHTEHAPRCTMDNNRIRHPTYAHHMLGARTSSGGSSQHNNVVYISHMMCRQICLCRHIHIAVSRNNVTQPNSTRAVKPLAVRPCHVTQESERHKQTDDKAHIKHTHTVNKAKTQKAKTSANEMQKLWHKQKQPTTRIQTTRRPYLSGHKHTFSYLSNTHSHTANNFQIIHTT